VSEDWAEKLRRGNSGTNYQIGRERRERERQDGEERWGWEERRTDKRTSGEERGRREVRKKTGRKGKWRDGRKKE